jgi:NitT/TauT family transport system substrate-binding protein
MLKMTRALGALGLAATMSVSAAAAQEAVKIGTQPWLGYGPLWVAAEKGFFQQRGVNVELVNFAWDQDVNAALASGNIQVQCAATNTLITLINQGVDAKGFLLMDASYEADAILAKTEIASIADLKGKSVAFEAGATSDLLLNYALGQNGMSIKDVEHVPMGASEAGLALIAGRVDVAVTYEPYISAALSQGEGYHVLYTSAERPGLISDLLIAETAFIDGNPEAIKNIILAWDDAVRFVRENPEEGGKIIADAVGSPMEEFTPAFKGVRLFDLKENKEQLAGPFQETFATIGKLLTEQKPDEIKTAPGADQALATGALMSLGN